MRAELFEQLLADRRAKRPAVLATVLATGEQTLLYPLEAPAPKGDVAGDVAGEQDADLAEAALAAARSDRCGIFESARGEVFLQVFNPPLRLAVVGAVHIAQSLYPMARMAGFAVTVIDPRTAFASAERFPGAHLDTSWPNEALARMGLDRRAAVVTLTHDPKLDEPALVQALGSDAFYIGALGSKKTQASRLARLREQGFDDGALTRIHGPVGLDIGARSAAEIAIAIMAQMVQTLRRRP